MTAGCFAQCFIIFSPDDGFRGKDKIDVGGIKILPDAVNIFPTVNFFYKGFRTFARPATC